METTLDDLNALLRECGCCEHHLCCPPLIECQSGSANVESVGFIDPGDDSDSGFVAPDFKKTRHLKRSYITTFGPPENQTSSYYNGTEWVDYTSKGFSGAVTRSTHDEYSQSFDGRIGGAYQCKESVPEYTTTCTISGSFSETSYAALYDPVSESWKIEISGRIEYTYEEVSGDETLDHIAWEASSSAWDAAHPGGVEAWQSAKDAHEAWQSAKDAHDDWATHLAEWLDEDPERLPENYPVPEPPLPGDDPGDPGDGRPEEPPAVYPPCSFQTTTTTYFYEITDEGGSPTYSLIASTEEDPNPSVSVSDGLSVPSGGETYETTYSIPVTYDEWLAAALAWIEANADFEALDHADSDSDSCRPGLDCYASRNVGPNAGNGNQSDLNERFFRFRIKLDKCCAWPDIKSKWMEVFYPQEWLDWKREVDAAGSESLPPEPAEKPDPTLRAWSWLGTPPRCEDSASDSAALNHYDHEAMWSPFGLVIRVPDDKFGEVRNRYYHQKCYEAPWQYMPQIFGEYETSESF